MRGSLLAMLFVLTVRAFGQDTLMPVNPKRLVGRISVGWNYYTRPLSVAPELNSVTNYVNLNYRFYDSTRNRIRYQIKLDAYQKTAFTAPEPIHDGHFRNRYIIRQLYASYGQGSEQFKLGRVIPYMTVIDAYPINGTSLENITLYRSFQLSAFGGTINDYYENKLTGSGYNTGASLFFKKTFLGIGAGFTTEKYVNQESRKAFLYGEAKPLSHVRIYHKTMYMLNRHLIGYSYTNLYYRFSRKWYVRLNFEYLNRYTRFSTLSDTVATPDKYFYQTNEKDVSLTAGWQVFYLSSIGSLDIMPSVKKRFGYDDLSYGNVQAVYRNYFLYRFQLGVEGGYTRNHWLQNIKTGGYLNSSFIKGKWDLTLSYYINSYRWIYQININNRSRETTSSIRKLSLISADLGTKISRSVYATLSVTGEIGNTDDSRLSLYARLNYSLR